MVGRCYVCLDVRETSVKVTQKNGNKTLICRECRNRQHAAWRNGDDPVRSDREIESRDIFEKRVASFLARKHPTHYITDSETWQRYASVALDKLSLRAKEMSNGN